MLVIRSKPGEWIRVTHEGAESPLWLKVTRRPEDAGSDRLTFAFHEPARRYEVASSRVLRRQGQPDRPDTGDAPCPRR